MKITEEAFKFGRNAHLAGVLARPEANPGAPPMPAVIIVNAGFVHHVGPWRLYVELSRELARQGLYVLRFDLSGLGDSGLSPGRQAVSERKSADIGDAIAFIQAEYGITDIIMLGLCSGAVDSHCAGLSHANIRGVVMLDPPAYPDALYYVFYYLERLSDPGRVMRYVKGLVATAGSGRVDQDRPKPLIHKPMPVEQFAGQVEKTTARGVRYLCTFTRNEDYNHKSQFYSNLTAATSRASISVHHFPHFDHTQILQADRQAVIEVVRQWILENFKGAGAVGDQAHDSANNRWRCWEAIPVRLRRRWSNRGFLKSNE